MDVKIEDYSLVTFGKSDRYLGGNDRDYKGGLFDSSVVGVKLSLPQLSSQGWVVYYRPLSLFP